MVANAKVEAKLLSGLFLEAFVESYDFIKEATIGTKYEMPEEWIRTQAAIIAHKAVETS
jgi:hypothetical protein